MSQPIFSTRMLVLMAIGIALNMTLGQLATMLKLPIFLDSLGTMLVARLFGHGMERIDGQHTQAAPATRTKRQALSHRAGGAQSSEGAWPPAEGQCVQRSQLQARLGQQSLDGRQQPV